jgi:AraC-like DNA-binding protein
LSTRALALSPRILRRNFRSLSGEALQCQRLPPDRAVSAAAFHHARGLYRRVKLEESKLLIRAGEMNVSQIAAHLNYSSVQQFSRQFKTKFGVSPNSLQNRSVNTDV